MCTKRSRDGIAPLTTALAKVAIVLAVFLFVECAAGSCLSYGHACWGAHGKRSGFRPRGAPFDESASPRAKEAAGARWLLSRLLQNALNYQQDRDLDMPMGQQHPADRQLFPVAAAADGGEPLKRVDDDWEAADQDDSIFSGRRDHFKNPTKDKRSILQ